MDGRSGGGDSFFGLYIFSMERHITYAISPTGEHRVQIVNQPYFPAPFEVSAEEEDNFTDASVSDKEEAPVEQEEIERKHMALRASTAPARPLTDVEEFRRSSNFMLLEHTVMCAAQLHQQTDQNYDLESEDGQRACKKFLNQVERLCEVFKASTASRSYREEFSKAYRVLYKDGSLCYLTEILDSAQERIPHLWVNGEKYVFSKEVLEAGGRLFNSFVKLQHVLKDIYSRICEETGEGSVTRTVQELAMALQIFDAHWVEFEQLYVLELMLIESDARRYIFQAIEVEKDMQATETKEKAMGRFLAESRDYNQCREALVTLMCKINAVANIEGKGRDDLSLDILTTAENFARRITSVQSSAVLLLAEQIKQAFSGFRNLLRRYEMNIEVVDPQLRNNPELVEVLGKFETSWEKGKTYFLNSKRCAQVVYFSNLIETLSEKYSDFREQLDCRDAELFLSLPGLLVLKCLEDQDKGICRHFFSLMSDETEKIGIHWKTLKRAYSLGKLASSSEEYCELLERLVLGLKVDPDFRTLAVSQRWDNLDQVVHKIKQIAMQLHRYKPVDWNKFLDVVLGTK